MQVCPSTQLPLPYVRNEAVGRPHQPQQLGFVGFLSAAQAAADRLAHISSLIASGTSPESLQSALSRAISRLQVRPHEAQFLAHPSEDGRRLGLPSGEVTLPLRPKSLGQLGRSRVQQCDSDPLERSTRFAEDSIRCNDDEPPTHPIQLFSAIDVASPLFWVLGVLTAVVLEQRLPLQVRHVVTPPPLTILSAHDDVDLGLRQASEDDKEADTSLLYRIDPHAGKARCSNS